MTQRRVTWFYSIFQRLNAELNLTTLIVSHDPEIAQHVGRVVAIRDGKTAAETVRRRRVYVHGQADETETDDQFEELIVLDSAGRLQIPKEYREQLAIKGHVRMEMQGDQLVVYPADYEKERDKPVLVPVDSGNRDNNNGSKDSVPNEADTRGEDHWLRNLWSGERSKGGKK